VFQGLQRVRFTDGTLREFREDVLAAADPTEAPEALHALTDALPPAPVRSAHDRARKARADKNATPAATAKR
jgi:hypothetical protein